MSENIPALIAEAREYVDAIQGGENENWMRLVQFVYEMAAALESLSAPSGDDREALEEILFDENNYERVHFAGSFEDEFRPRKAAGAILAAGFRRPSPVTREALEEVIERGWYAGEHEATIASETGYAVFEGKSLNAIPPRRAAEAVLSAFSLPEPAEVEWGTRWSGYTDNRGFMPAHSRESAEAVLEEFEGHEVIYRTPAGPWVPVKGTEQ